MLVRNAAQHAFATGPHKYEHPASPISAHGVVVVFWWPRGNSALLLSSTQSTFLVHLLFWQQAFHTADIRERQELFPMSEARNFVCIQTMCSRESPYQPSKSEVLMASRRALAALFASVLISLLAMTAWASLQQPIWEWRGLTQEPDRWWTIATLMDAYFGFLTFFVWVCFKERGMGARAFWFFAIMTLGNIAMASYVLLQLAKLPAGAHASAILTARSKA